VLNVVHFLKYERILLNIWGLTAAEATTVPFNITPFWLCAPQLFYPTGTGAFFNRQSQAWN
jgi:hypothetical protein